MTRIGIVVQPDFLLNHVGVRNYLFSLYRYLSLAADVRFVSFFRPQRQLQHWFYVHLQDPAFLRNNGVTEDWRIEGSPAAVLDRYHATAGHQADQPPAIWTSHIGSNLESAGFDTLVLGNPWLVDFADRLPVRRQVGIVYDAIPNRYVLTEAEKPYEFAAQHLAGFRYFRDHCDRTLAISESVTDDLTGLLHFPPERVGFLPPLVPADCLAAPTGPAPRRTGAVVLASPLDRRKGLEQMPRLIAAAGRRVDRVTMYGAVRCSPDQLKAFFRGLPSRLSLEWYPRATGRTTERLFREGRLLLFPSLNEGLGLPLIEAQLRGCPVVTRDARPMSDLVVAGSRLLTDDPAADDEVVRQLAGDADFDHATFEAAARAFFRTDDLPARVLHEIVGG